MDNKITSADQATLDEYRDRFQSAEPFPHIVFEDFLAGDWAQRVAKSYPSFGDACKQGKVFESVNEHLKLQISDSSRFPAETLELHETLASPEFLDRLSYISGIPSLIADPELAGGGIHQTGPHGRLDVHVDFNFQDDRQIHRRLNILVYLNPEWREDWGGRLELWDEDVKRCYASLPPILNRCVIFATSEKSFHGVTALECPEDRARQSFAAYYYTKEPPPGWDGKAHCTVFRARPDEKVKKYFSMPAEKLVHALQGSYDSLKQGVKKILK